MKQTLLITFFLFIVTLGFAQTDRYIASAYTPKKASKDAIIIGECFPRVASDNFCVTLKASKSQRSKIYILNNNKEALIEKTVMITTSENTLQLPTYDLPSGKYILYVQGEKSYTTMNFYVSH
ncbi:MAG: hypothetical protein K1X92_09275 [Bacteroidia bacterium]|nr:hypothetical protein [Bacteroidia bacterium]